MNRAALVAQLERDEGLRLKPYLDTATPPRLTIGIGRNLTDCGISRDEAYLLLDHDLDACIADLNTFPWFPALSDVRQRALVSMRFNVGPRGFRTFQRMLTLLAGGHYTAAAREMLESRWARQVPNRADRIATMMITDEDVP